MKGFQSEKAETTREGVPQLSHLRIYRPTTEYLLAMKCMAARALSAETGGDERDIRILVEKLNFSSVEQVLAVVTRFFPPERVPAKTQFMIHEVMEKLSKENS